MDFYRATLYRDGEREGTGQALIAVEPEQYRAYQWVPNLKAWCLDPRKITSFFFPDPTEDLQTQFDPLTLEEAAALLPEIKPLDARRVIPRELLAEYRAQGEKPEGMLTSAEVGLTSDQEVGYTRSSPEVQHLIDVRAGVGQWTVLKRYSAEKAATGAPRQAVRELRRSKLGDREVTTERIREGNGPEGTDPVVVLKIR